MHVSARSSDMFGKTSNVEYAPHGTAGGSPGREGAGQRMWGGGGYGAEGVVAEGGVGTEDAGRT